MGNEQYTDDLVRGAHTWYMAEPGRSSSEVAVLFGLNRRTFGLRVRALGLPMKSLGRAGTDRYRVPTYQRVLAAYRAGGHVTAMCDAYHVTEEALYEILRDAGEACVRCGILLRATAPEGVAVLSTGDRVCQACVEEAGYPVARWEREPVEMVTEYAEIGNWRDGEEGTCDD